MKALPILVADDETAVCRVVELLLRREGHVVVTCPDGRTALGLLQTDEFAVLLTDLNLPGIDGLELARLARAGNPNLPVVVMSGQDTLELAAAESNPDRVYRLPKPFKPQDLLALIASITAGDRNEDRRAG